MPKLTILDWDNKERSVDFVGYNADHTICYIYDHERARQVLILKLPHRFNFQFRKNPIPDFPPTSITRAILRLPTCFASKKEMQIFEQPSDNWPAAVKTLPLKEQLKLAYPPKMYVGPEDETKLDRLLAKESQQLRREYQARKRRIESLPPGQREMGLRALEAEFITEVRDYLSCSFKMVNALNVTLEDAKHGALGLREKMLYEEYAKKTGLNPAMILAEARRFRSWIERSAISVNHLDEARWVGLEMCVRFEIAFFDGSRCWLNEVKQVGLTDARQVEEFSRLEAAAQVVGDEQMTLDEVCRALTVKRKGESKPITSKGLMKLCQKANVPFKFPMRRSVFKRLEEHRQRQARKKSERMRRRNRKTDV